MRDDDHSDFWKAIAAIAFIVAATFLVLAIWGRL